MSDQNFIWFVEDGWVEIYLQPGARRRFVTEFRKGSVLLGGVDPSVGMILLVPEHARLVRISASAFLPSPDNKVDGRAVQAMDTWIAGLSHGIARQLAQRPSVQTVAAREAAAVGADESLSATGGVAWAALPPGTSTTFLGQVDLSPGRRLPISPTTWLTFSSESSVPTYATVDVIAARCAFGDLLYFHEVLGQLAARWDAEQFEAEAAALATSQTAVGDTMSAALRRLDGLLTEKRKPQRRGDLDYLLGQIVVGFKSARPLPPDVDLPTAVQMLNLRTRKVVLAGDWWRHDIGRLATVRLSDGKPVALVPDWLGRYRCLRNGEPPARVTKSLCDDLEADALAILEPLPARKVVAMDLVRVCFRATRGDFFVLVAASATVSLLGLVLPVAMGYVIDTFVPSRMRVETIVLGFFVAAVTLANSGVHFCSEVARQRMDGIIEKEIGGKIMERILHLPSKLLKSFSAADLALRFASVDQVRRVVMNAGLDTLLSGLFGLSGLALLFVYSPTGALVVLLLFALLVGLSVVAGFAQLRTIATGEAMTANESSLRLQLIQNVATLRSFSAERRAFSLWASNATEMRARSLRSRLVTSAFQAFLALYPGLALGAVFLALGLKNTSGLSTGSYLAFLTAYQNFSFASVGIAQSITQLVGLMPTMKRAASVLASEPEVLAGARPPGVLSGAVAVSRVSFRYSPEGRQILDDVDFEIAPGEFVAICGGSGSGKSTLLNLLVGFDRPQSGAVLFDGMDLAKLDLSAVRRQIGLVRQASRLFGGSIAENIIGAQQATVEDAWLAAELAGIANDIKALPMGMHTVITEGVSTFSGGQLQRLMIARALVSRPRIVIFDEATSALDNITQNEVTRNIERLGASRIVVAHRLSTIRNADRVLFLDGGKIVERGSYDELMAANGKFHEFGRRQMLEMTDA